MTGFENYFAWVIGIVACHQRRSELVRQSCILPFLNWNIPCQTGTCQTRLQMQLQLSVIDTV